MVPKILRRVFSDDFFDESLLKDFKKKNLADYNLMNADIKEKKDNYLLEIELPGFKKEDIRAEIINGYLIIRTTHEDKKEDIDEKYIRRERYSGHCMRSFYIGENITQEEIKAKFENGLLKLEIPKKESQEKIEKKSGIQIEE